MDNSHNEPKSNATSFKSHLLQTYGQETSETFKHCSNLVLKASKNSCHVSFLKCCRDFNLTPKGLRLKNPMKTERSKSIISKAQSLVLTSELNGYKSTFSSSSKELKLSLDTLKTAVSDTDYKCIMRLNNIKANAIMVTAIKKHSKKFH